MTANQTSTTDNQSANVRIFNLILLDASGSMGSIQSVALKGLNQTLASIREAQREHPEQTHSVTLAAFDSMSTFNPLSEPSYSEPKLRYMVIYDNTPAAEAVDLRPNQYRPDGGTPLYDAMGRALNDLRRRVTPDDIVLVTIITDGYENSSREWTRTSIRTLVDLLTADNWVFTYIGANQDVDAVSSSIGIRNSMAFEADEADTERMFCEENMRRKSFYIRCRKDSRENLRDGYFEK
jgi:Mg-chelatase subunit ChlD